MGNKAVVHQTQGLLDIRAFTLMGVSAKPNSLNPFGMFGTGLKYAIAVLVRHGAKPVVYIGKDRYVFSTREIDFRGKGFQQLLMRRERWNIGRAMRMKPQYEGLPFTTEYGKNWKMWQVYRELEANTRDENGGVSYVVDDAASVEGEEGFTHIVVEWPEYVEAHEKANDVFLPQGLRVADKGSELLERREGETNRIYYRGVRVMDAGKPFLCTYNILRQMDLTEDRTLAYEYMLQDTLARYVVGSDDEKYIERFLTADECYYESGLEMPRHATPSETFVRVANRFPRGMRASVHRYVSSYTPEAKRKTGYARHPRPWFLDSEESAFTINDARGMAVMEVPSGYSGDWADPAKLVVEAVNNGTNRTNRLLSIAAHYAARVMQTDAVTPGELKEFLRARSVDPPQEDTEMRRLLEEICNG